MIKRYGPGEEAKIGEYKKGDFILTHSDSFYGWLIRFGQRLRYWGKDRKYTRWNHAAIIISDDGDLMEALSNGVVKTKISHYKDTEYHLISLGAEISDNRDRTQEVSFADASWHESYGWLTIVSIAFGLITGCKITFGVEGQTICSGLVARCLERTSVIIYSNSANVTPAALAKYFNVLPPSTNVSKGIPPKGRRGSKPPGKK